MLGSSAGKIAFIPLGHLFEIVSLVTFSDSFHYTGVLFRASFYWAIRILQDLQGRGSTIISSLKLQYTEHIIYLIVTIKSL